MSKVFRSIAPGSSATVEFVGADGNVTIYVRQNIGAVDLSSDEAPAIAIAILEASGLVRDNCSADEAEISLEWLYSAVAKRQQEAKEAADREALEMRRNEVATELGGDTISYKMCNRAFQNAIDRIIELEDKAKS